MVEIARAFTVTDQPVRLVILDEPTSSLDAVVARQLLDFVRRFAAEGGSTILISHLLGEVLSTADRVVVMRDGLVVRTDRADAFTRDSLVAAMGHIPETATRAGRRPRSTAAGLPLRVRADLRAGETISLAAHEGEIVGLAGLAGQGQTEMLLRVFDGARGDTEVSGTVAVVAGDRQTDGIFPLWSITRNISIGSLREMLRGWLVDATAETSAGRRPGRTVWPSRRRTWSKPILSLSGGNQQKALFARALGSEAGHHPHGRSDARRGRRHQARGLSASSARRPPAAARSSGTRPRPTSWSTATTSTSSATAPSWPTCPRDELTEEKRAARVVPGRRLSVVGARQDRILGLEPRRLRALLPAVSLLVVLRRHLLRAAQVGELLRARPPAATWPCRWRSRRSPSCSS